MLKALKMDFYRFFKTKSFYIILAALTASCAIMIWSFYITSTAMTSDMGLDLGESFLELLPHTVDEYFDAFLQGNFLVLFTVIFAVLFCSAEYKNGYIKNIASIVSKRSGLVFSKLICILCAIVIMHIITVLCIIAGCAGIIGITEVQNIRGIVLEVIWGIIMNFSIASVIVMLFMITRKATFPMITGIIYVLMGSSVFSLADLIAEKVFKASDFTVAKYTNMGNMLYFVNSSASSETLIRSGIVAAVFFALSSVVSCILINRKDIR